MVSTPQQWPSTPKPAPVLRHLYAFALLAFAVSYPLFPRIHSTIESILVLLFLALAFFTPSARALRPTLLRDPIFRLSLALLAFLLLAQVWYHFTRPDYIDASTRAARYYLKPLMILVVGAGLNLCGRQWSWRFLSFAMAGLVLYLVFKTDPQTWLRAQAGHRVDFGIHNAEHTALFFGTSLLALLAFAPRMIRSRPGLKRLAISCILILLVGLAVFGTLVAQTRAAWLGLLVALGIATLLAPWLLSRRQANPSRHLARYTAVFAGIITLLVSIAIAGFDADNLIAERLARENVSLSSITQAAELESSPTTSVSIRIATWSAATHWIAQRPWLGWGPDATESLIQQSDVFSPWFKKNFGHVHNTFFESLIANGLIGSAILLAIMLWLGIALTRAYREGRLPLDVYILSWVFFGFWLVVNAFESYSLYPTGQYINAVMGGFLYSFCLKLDPGESSHA
ncbi:MAG: O-antigen ligase family protein [Marinobacter sp.]|nr:O-antigen ligase family protein [Marinobacter sp.]